MDDEVDDEGYSLDKETIIEAWARFRPVNKTDEAESDSPVKRGNSAKKDKNKPRTATKNVKEIFGKIFTRKILSGVRLKLYNFSETEAQIKQKKDFKSEFTLWYQ